jgi:hypothetical protein
MGSRQWSLIWPARHVHRFCFLLWLLNLPPIEVQVAASSSQDTGKAGTTQNWS